MKSLLLAFILIYSGLTFAQDGMINKPQNQHSFDLTTEEFAYFVPHKKRKLRRRSLYFELGGSGGFGSINYEWNFHSSERIRWMLRTGLSGTYIDKNNGAGIIFPVMVHGVYGNTHGLDVGIGQAFTITTRGSFFLRAPVSVGYRFEPKEKRMFYRFSYTPIVSYLLDFQWEHWGGITIGYKLRHRIKM